MNIATILDQMARDRPDQPAIIDTHRSRTRISTFGDLHRMVVNAAQMLDIAELKAGDTVLVFQPMSLELYVILLALFRRSLAAMFADPGSGLHHIERCCFIGNPEAMVASKKASLLRLVSPALRRIPSNLPVDWFSMLSMVGSKPEPIAEPDTPSFPIEETPALLTFTSGSTGEPKAAIRTHGFLLAQHAVLARSLNLTAGSVDLATLPIFVLANLASGVTSIIPNADLRRPGSIDPRPVIAQIDRHQPSTSGASPAFFDRIVDYCLREKRTMDTLKTIFTGGAPVFPALLDKFHSVAPQARIVAVYGSTEAEPIAHIAMDEITSEDRDRMMSGSGLVAGRKVDAIDVRVIADNWGRPIGPFDAAQFDALVRDPNSPGEIVVSGDHVLSGYRHGKGDEETKFKVNGVVWHRTGDAGYIDDHGRLWLFGRASAKIEDDHGIVYPFAVETAVHDYPGLLRSAVVRHKGRRILVVQMERSNRDCVNAIRDRVSWANLDDVVAVGRIPVDKRHNAKVDYPALMRLLG